MAVSRRVAWRCLAWGIAGSVVALAASADERLPTGAGQCMSCHGEFGISRDDITPHIGGQPAAYLKQALRAYRDGLRKGAEASRMTPFAQPLREEDLDALANFFATLKVPQ
jgi:cytochrome c553